MSKPYWYILHITSGSIVKYHGKVFSKKAYHNKETSTKVSGTDFIDKLARAINGDVSGWDYPNFASLVIDIESDTTVAWASVEISKERITALGPIKAYNFNNFIDTRKNAGNIKFNCKIDARDFLRDIVKSFKNYADVKLTEDEFAIVCSDGTTYDYNAAKATKLKK